MGRMLGSPEAIGRCNGRRGLSRPVPSHHIPSHPDTEATRRPAAAFGAGPQVSAVTLGSEGYRLTGSSQSKEQT